MTLGDARECDLLRHGVLRLSMGLTTGSFKANDGWCCFLFSCFTRVGSVPVYASSIATVVSKDLSGVYFAGTTTDPPGKPTFSFAGSAGTTFGTSSFAGSPTVTGGN